MNENLTYQAFIDNILQTRGRFNCGDEYHERHHIVPKCLGGTNDEDNLIDLFAREHFEAHRLLALENPEQHSLQYAWWNMCQIQGNDGQERYIPTAEEFEQVRKICSKLSSERNSGENHPMFGLHHTVQTRDKMSKAHKGQRVGEKNPMFGKHHDREWKDRNSKMMKERHKNTPHPMGKKVVCDGVIFQNIAECAKAYGQDRTTMSRWLRGKYKMPEKFVELGLNYYCEDD